LKQVEFLLLAGTGGKQWVPAESGGGVEEVGFGGLGVPLESVVTAQ
jgi:hypothetical protein